MVRLNQLKALGSFPEWRLTLFAMLCVPMVAVKVIPLEP